MKSILKVSTILGLLMVFAGCAKDEVEMTGGISGRVIDFGNNEPLSGGDVSLSNVNQPVTTGSDGRYEFRNLKPGKYMVQVMCNGYKTNTIQVEVIPGEIVSGDIQLTPGNEDFALSTNNLQFEPGNMQKSFDIINTSISKSIDWKILNGFPSWLSVSETKGIFLKPGGQRAITVALQNNPVVGSEGYITVEVDGSSKQIYVVVVGAGNTTGGLSGLVTGIDQNRGLAGNVSLSPGGQRVTTGSDGRYEFLNLEPGQYTVSVSCNGYKSAEKSFSVVAGKITSGDIQLSLEAAGFSLSASSLGFTSVNTLKSFDIINSSNSQSISWKILTGYPSWLSVSEMNGTLLPAGQRAINVNLKNTPASGSEGYITVEVAGSTRQAYVNFTGTGSGGGDGGDGGGSDEDYSSVTIQPCDSRLKAAVVSCNRFGSSVVFTYTLKNNGLGNVSDFRIYPPSAMSLVNDGVRSVITDDRGNEYPGAKMSFRGGSASASNIIGGTLPEGITCTCTVTLTGVPSNAKKLGLVRVGVYAYPDSFYHLVNKYIDFGNVPIY